jgi:hypothetical protein
MTSVTETLCAIERRAERAVVHELRLMTQEILAMRTHLSFEDRAHADALLLKLDHLERCQCVDALPPGMLAGAELPTVPPHDVSPIAPGCPNPGAFLVHYYSHDIGELEQVRLASSLQAAVQLVKERVDAQALRIHRVRQRAADGEIAFLADDDVVLASVVPCEASAPDVSSGVAQACTLLQQRGDISLLHLLFVRAPAATAERLAA